MKTWFRIFAVSIVILLIAVVLSRRSTPNVGQASMTIPGTSTTLSLKIADDNAERAQGLSDIQFADLGADGMLFVFDDKTERRFWMKGMQFSLDIVWIDDTKIVKIERNVLPPQFQESPAVMLSAPFAVNRVVEVPAGKAAEYGLKEGMDVVIALDGASANW